MKTISVAVISLIVLSISAFALDLKKSSPKEIFAELCKDANNSKDVTPAKEAVKLWTTFKKKFPDAMVIWGSKHGFPRMVLNIIEPCKSDVANCAKTFIERNGKLLGKVDGVEYKINRLFDFEISPEITFNIVSFDQLVQGITVNHKINVLLVNEIIFGLFGEFVQDVSAIETKPTVSLEKAEVVAQKHLGTDLRAYAPWMEIHYLYSDENYHLLWNFYMANKLVRVNAISGEVVEASKLPEDNSSDITHATDFYYDDKAIAYARTYVNMWQYTNYTPEEFAILFCYDEDALGTPPFSDFFKIYSFDEIFLEPGWPPRFCYYWLNANNTHGGRPYFNYEASENQSDEENRRTHSAYIYYHTQTAAGYYRDFFHLYNIPYTSERQQPGELDLRDPLIMMVAHDPRISPDINCPTGCYRHLGVESLIDWNVWDYDFSCLAFHSQCEEEDPEDCWKDLDYWMDNHLILIAPSNYRPHLSYPPTLPMHEYSHYIGYKLTTFPWDGDIFGFDERNAIGESFAIYMASSIWSWYLSHRAGEGCNQVCEPFFPTPGDPVSCTFAYDECWDAAIGGQIIARTGTPDPSCKTFWYYPCIYFCPDEHDKGRFLNQALWDIRNGVPEGECDHPNCPQPDSIYYPYTVLPLGGLITDSFFVISLAVNRGDDPVAFKDLGLTSVYIALIYALAGAITSEQFVDVVMALDTHGVIETPWYSWPICPCSAGYLHEHCGDDNHACGIYCPRGLSKLEVSKQTYR